jgi:hypothetical protein
MTDQPLPTWNQPLTLASRVADRDEEHSLADRRQRSRSSQDGMERRQFGSNYSELTPAGAEFGKAIDSYKVAHRRRYVTYDEILLVLETLGYERRPAAGQQPVDATTTIAGSAGLPVTHVAPLDSTSVQSID